MISLLLEDVKNEYLCASDNDKMIGERSVFPRVPRQSLVSRDLSPIYFVMPEKVVARLVFGC